jgi:hypothetical protein
MGIGEGVADGKKWEISVIRGRDYRGYAWAGTQRTGEKTTFGRNNLHHAISSWVFVSSFRFGWTRGEDDPTYGSSMRGWVCFRWVRIVFNLLNSYNIVLVCLHAHVDTQQSISNKYGK